MGLVNKIQTAKSTTEIESLLSEGKTFRYAMSKTVRRWKVVADRRTRELQRNTEVAAVETKKLSKKAKA